MQNRIIKLNTKREKWIYFLKHAVFLALGFFLSRAKILDSISFLGFAFCSACPAPFYASAVFGSVFGYLSLFLGIDSIRFICCTLGAAMIKSFVLRIKDNDIGEFFMPTAALLCSFVTALAVFLSEEKTAERALFFLTECLMSFVLTYCFSKPLEFLILNKQKSKRETNLICSGVSLCALFIALCGVDFLSFSIARALGSLFIMLCAFNFKEKGGAISGASIGASSAFAFSDIRLGAIYPCAGLLCSLFSAYGQIAIAAVFLFTCTLIAFLYPSENAVPLIAESAVASFIFILIPKDKLKKLNITDKKISFKDKNTDPVKEKIKNIEAALFSLGASVKDVFNKLSKIEDENIKSDSKTDELRLAIADGFFTSSDILNEIFEEFNSSDDFKNENILVEKALNTLGIKAQKINISLNEKVQRIIEINLGDELSNEKIKELSKSLNESLSAEFKVSTDDKKHIELREKPKYKLRIGTYQETGGESQLCGDSFTYKLNDDKLNLIVLSDGMGTGGRAAVDSMMTVTLFSSLIESSLSPDTALKLINSALIAKSDDETLATLDVVLFNPFSGEAQILKAGGAPSFIRRDNESLEVELTTLPAGILRNIKFSGEHIFLSEDDMIVLLSDGALTGNYSWIGETISNTKLDAQSLAVHIAKTARQKQMNMKKDDLTVITIELKRE